MGRVYELDKEKSLTHQVLSYAGWYEGRKVEIDKIEKYYLKYGYKLNESAKKIFSGVCRYKRELVFQLQR